MLLGLWYLSVISKQKLSMITQLFPLTELQHIFVHHKNIVPQIWTFFLLYTFQFGIKAERILHQYGKIINVQTLSDAEGSSELNMKTSMVIFKRWSLLTSEKLPCDSVKQLQATSSTCNQPVLYVTKRFIVHKSEVKHAWSFSSVILRSEILIFFWSLIFCGSKWRRTPLPMQPQFCCLIREKTDT